MKGTAPDRSFRLEELEPRVLLSGAAIVPIAVAPALVTAASTQEVVTHDQPSPADSVPVQATATTYDPAAALGNIFDGVVVAPAINSASPAGAVSNSAPDGAEIVGGAGSQPIAAHDAEEVSSIPRAPWTGVRGDKGANGGAPVGAEETKTTSVIAEQLVESLTAANGPPGSEFEESGESGDTTRAAASAGLADLSLAAAVWPASVNATISWDGGGDGNSWGDRLNWSDDTLPGPSDDVVIDVAGDVMVTISGGGVSIHSLQSTETIVLNGDGLTMTAASSVNQLQWNGGGTISAPGGLTVLGTLTVANGNDRTFIVTAQVDLAG